jgi:hypothetical protein
VAAFEELVDEALTAPFSGWDFSWLAARSRAAALPWSYRRVVAGRAAAAGAMLDMGTGGGERLSRLSPRPRWPRTWAARFAGVPICRDVSPRPAAVRQWRSSVTAAPPRL